MNANQVFEAVVFIATLASAISAYFAMRGRNFGLTDLALFAPLAGITDVVTYQLVHILLSGGGESDAYMRLLALLALFAAIPAALVCSVIFLSALFVALAEYKKLRLALLAIAVIALIVHLMPAKPDADHADIPFKRARNNKLAGENWALESGATSPAECDKQSTDRAFREGCTHQVNQAAR